jgi:hypothetical protein
VQVNQRNRPGLKLANSGPQAAKRAGDVARDERQNTALEADCWNVVALWECETRREDAMLWGARPCRFYLFDCTAPFLTDTSKRAFAVASMSLESLGYSLLIEETCSPS